MAHPVFNKSTLHTLRYFRTGHDRDASRFWLADDRTPQGRLSRLVAAQLIEAAPAPNADLYRITQAGLNAIGEAA